VCAPSLLHTTPIYLTLVESQISELGTIRRSLFDLEAQYERAHGHYEEEIKCIRSELVAVRQSGTAPVSLRIPGRSPRQLGAPLPFPNTSDAQTSSQLLRHRALHTPMMSALPQIFCSFVFEDFVHFLGKSILVHL
jgi:hypothetical protein